MPDSNIVAYIASELAVVLLLVCVFLIMHVGKLKKLVAKLEEKIISLRKSVGKSRNETKAALKKLAAQKDIPVKDFTTYLDEEISVSRDYHQSLNPDRDIVLDIAPDAPLERQATALRHAFLIAEKEARYAGEDDQSSWDVLQLKLQQIIQFYESVQPAAEADDEPAEDAGAEAEIFNEEEIEAYKKRIENLEKFKNLFFEMESKWEAASSQAQDYQQQLKNLGKELGAGDDFDQLLSSYSTAFNDVGSLISEAVSGGERPQAESGVEFETTPHSVGKTVIANQEEMQRLRNMAVDQHKLINELKKKLYESASTEAQQEAVASLSQELEQQQRYMKEMETCTQLIEDELSRALTENEQLRAQVEGGASDEPGVEKIENMVSELTSEGKEMLSTIATLEDENQRLKQQLEVLENAGGGSAGAGEDSAALKEKLNEMQQELLNLQTQHIELEERYLELKMQ